MSQFFVMVNKNEGDESIFFVAVFRYCFSPLVLLHTQVVH